MNNQPSQSALEIWQERLESFQKELAITANPTMKFELRKQIEECQQKIRELAAVTSQERLLIDKEDPITDNGQAISLDLGEITKNTDWYTFKEYGKPLTAIASPKDRALKVIFMAAEPRAIEGSVGYDYPRSHTTPSHRHLRGGERLLR